MKNSICWQERKGIRQTALQSSWFRVVVFEETWNILQPNTPPQANALPPLDTHRKSLTKDLQRPTLTNQWWSHYTVIPPYLSLRFLERETERLRDRDFENERERDLDADLDREERDPDLDLFVFDISEERVTFQLYLRIKQMSEPLCKPELLWTLRNKQKRWNDCFREVGEGEMYGESNMEIYNTICKIDSHWEFAMWLRELKHGLWESLEGWDGEEDGS